MNHLLMLGLVLALAGLSAVQAQSGGTFNEPPGQRRQQTYRVLEYEDGTINQRYKGTLRYYCTFRGKWSEERHPRDFPKSPSFSAPIMISHSNGYRMWTGTEAATLGVEAIAEVRFYENRNRMNVLFIPCDPSKCQNVHPQLYSIHIYY